MQKEACRNFAESQGWEIVKEFSEKGVSGFKKSAKERDELQKVQQAAMEGKFDILLVFMFDRIGRIADETPFVVEWFVKNGIRVWSTKRVSSVLIITRTSSPTTSAFGRLTAK